MSNLNVFHFWYWWKWTINSKVNILNLFGNEIKFNNLNYELRSIICFINRNHFSTFIWKLDSPYIALFENKFDKEWYYYHDGGIDNDIIKPIDSIEILYSKIYAYPYIFIYNKKD